MAANTLIPKGTTLRVRFVREKWFRFMIRSRTQLERDQSQLRKLDPFGARSAQIKMDFLYYILLRACVWATPLKSFAIFWIRFRPGQNWKLYAIVNRNSNSLVM